MATINWIDIYTEFNHTDDTLEILAVGEQRETGFRAAKVVKFSDIEKMRNAGK